MKLQILVAHYKDGQEAIERLLDSVKLQQNIDFNDVGVIIVNDGDKVVLDTKNFYKYPFKIEYHIEEWSDIAGVRYKLLNYATADYVMFSDGDDLFYRLNALWDIFDHIDKEQPDILTSQFTEDVWNWTQKKWAYFVNHNNENVWLHGKAFNLKFLKDNNIQSEPALLHYYEDSYMVRLAFALAKKKINIDETIWWWKFRETSITRSDYDWPNKTYVQKINSNEALVKAFLERNMIADAANYIFVQVYECYFTLLQDTWDKEEFKQYKPGIEARIKEYYLKYKDYLKEVPESSAIVMMNVLRKRFYTDLNRLSLEPISFNDWLNNILNK